VHIKFHPGISPYEPLPDDLSRIPDQFKFFEEWIVVNSIASISPSVEVTTLDALCRDLDTTPICQHKLDELYKALVVVKEKRDRTTFAIGRLLGYTVEDPCMCLHLPVVTPNKLTYLGDYVFRSDMTVTDASLRKPHLQLFYAMKEYMFSFQTYRLAEKKFQQIERARHSVELSTMNKVLEFEYVRECNGHHVAKSRRSSKEVRISAKEAKVVTLVRVPRK
jgi:hypothetical protein